MKAKQKKTALQTPAIIVLSLGDELLHARSDSNGPAIARALEELGCPVQERAILPDQAKSVVQHLRAWLRKPAWVICCGGLGPTQDDVTRMAVAEAMHRPLKFQPQVYAVIQKRFAQMKWVCPEINRVQAMLPAGAEVLPNPWGTAPGFFIHSGSGVVAALPGPPRECLPMLRQELMPRLRQLRGRNPNRIGQVELRICGVGEGRLQEILGPIFAASPLGLAFVLDEPGEIMVKLTAQSRDPRALRQMLNLGRRKVKQALGMNVVDGRGRSLPEVVGELLVRRRQTLAVAESCTGGRIAQRLTAVPGSSRYFLEGVVTYSNDAKRRRLQVPALTLKSQGAVSRAVAQAMAEGSRRTTGADWALAVTGITGPAGGSSRKPVGLVHMAWAGPKGRGCARQERFPGEREHIQRRAATRALDMLRRALLERTA